MDMVIRYIATMYQPGHVVMSLITMHNYSIDCMHVCGVATILKESACMHADQEMNTSICIKNTIYTI